MKKEETTSGGCVCTECPRDCPIRVPCSEAQKKFNKGHQPKDEEYPPLADNSKIGL